MSAARASWRTSAQPPTDPTRGRVPEKRLLSVEEAAACMSIGRDAVFDLIRTGGLRSITIGSRRLIAVTAIDDYIARREAEQAGES